MFCESEFIKILNVSGALSAIRYMRHETGFSLSECKTYLDNIKEACIEVSGKYERRKTGTITWFSCKIQLPPKDNNGLFGYSVQVLVTDGKRIEESIYCHNPSQGIPYWHTTSDLLPTHWAYINLPVT